VRVGDHNVFREHVTVHRSSSPAGQTSIGDGNLLMTNSHVGHDTTLGNNVILTNGALLGGHVLVEDRAIISGNCLVHQFTRIGAGAMMQGGAGISKDLPPFTLARGDNGMCGLNVIGLRRAGITAEERLALKRLYRLLFRSGKRLRIAIEEARGQFAGEACRRMIEFVAASRRGICRDTAGFAEPAID